MPACLLQHMLRAWVPQCVALLQQRQRCYLCSGGESKIEMCRMPHAACSCKLGVKACITALAHGWEMGSATQLVSVMCLRALG